jgi:hypothetical protein
LQREVEWRGGLKGLQKPSPLEPLRGGGSGFRASITGRPLIATARRDHRTNGEKGREHEFPHPSEHGFQR